MAYRIKRGGSVARNVRRIATEQLDKAIAEIQDPEIDQDVTVHQVRKRCKKLRGLLRLVRPALGETYRRENAAFRDAARSISAIRDRKSIIGTYDDLMDRFQDQVDRPAFASVRRQLTENLKAIDVATIDAKLDEVRQEFEDAKERVRSWELSEKGFDAVGPGLAKTRRRCAKRLADALKDPSTETLHQLRKRAKYHWYHLRLLKSTWKPAIKPLAKCLDDLSDDLGDDHDLAVLLETIHAAPESYGRPADLIALKGLADQRRRELQAEALTTLQFVLAESAQDFDKRLEAYWRLWRR